MSDTAKPMIQFDPAGSPVVLSYNLPEPTSYQGRHVIEYDYDESYFLSDNRKQDTPENQSPQDVSPESDLQSDDNPEIPLITSTPPRPDLGIYKPTELKKLIQDAYKVAKQ